MVDVRDIQEWLLQLTRKVWSWLSPTGLGLLLDLARRLYHSVVRASPAGMYEILDYDSTLELLDAKGKSALSRRRQRVRFLQDDVIAFQDHAWGEGELFAKYRVAPGVVADRYREGDRWNVLISLRETKSKGDIEEFIIERTVKNGFTQKEEWWQVAVWYRTLHLKLTLLFPKTRPCRRMQLHTRAANRTLVLGPQHFRILPDGRQQVVWETEHPRQAEIYTLRWHW
jgi:hypothetical protein